MEFLLLIGNKLLKNGLAIFLSLVAVSLHSLSAAAQSADLLILYPEVRAPFSKVFDAISSGAEEGFNGGANSEAVSEKSSVDKLLKKNRPDIVLVLGKRSLNGIQKLDSKMPIVLGAISGQQKNYPGISMVPDPKIILDKLVLLSPSVKKIHVVKKSQGSDIQLEGASKYLASIGKELIVHESTDIRQAASIYGRLIDGATEGDAVWILQDGSYVNSAILSLLLDVAWSKNLVVFSSNPIHVKHGALFAVYPDNKGMGVSLGRLANKVLNGSVEPGMETLKDTLLAVNERTSNHLGISLSKEVKENVNLLLPAR
jgi:putative tryptophan/tyrosine transport system substrate-binding protein